MRQDQNRFLGTPPASNKTVCQIYSFSSWANSSSKVTSFTKKTIINQIIMLLANLLNWQENSILSKNYFPRTYENGRRELVRKKLFTAHYQLHITSKLWVTWKHSPMVINTILTSLILFFFNNIHSVESWSCKTRCWWYIISKVDFCFENTLKYCIGTQIHVSTCTVYGFIAKLSKFFLKSIPRS